MTRIYAVRWFRPRNGVTPGVRTRRVPTFSHHTLSASLAVLASGCSLLGLGDTERLGLLEFYGESASITVPDTVNAGAAFEVAFYTFGGGCISRGDTSLDVTGNIVVVTPTDIHSGADVCTADLRYLDHTTTIRLNAPGGGTVVINGRSEPGDSSVQRVFPVVVK